MVTLAKGRQPPPQRGFFRNCPFLELLSDTESEYPCDHNISTFYQTNGTVFSWVVCFGDVRICFVAYWDRHCSSVWDAWYRPSSHVTDECYWTVLSSTPSTNMRWTRAPCRCACLNLVRPPFYWQRPWSCPTVLRCWWILAGHPSNRLDKRLRSPSRTDLDRIKSQIRQLTALFVSTPRSATG